ncbi:MAG TPA: IclR family transcriptional regulator [Beijerinckiaceae bacterium]|nr:IclR family transcriptional regulator [Beijerinckiaceae bacterium]
MLRAGRATEPDAASDRGVATRARTGVQSLARAFGILEEVAQHRGGISLADLSKRVGLHNSTTFHLVRTMVILGYVRQERETKRYHVGRMVFSLAASSLTEVELVGLATPILEDLARETGESSHLAIRRGEDIVIAARVAGSGAFQLVDRAGGVRPAHCTALGKVLLAAMPPERFERYLTSAQLDASTPKSITDPTLLKDEIERVRAAGIGYDDGEFDPEVRCVAVPVRDFTGQVAGAIGISGPVWRLSLARLQAATTRVLAAAAALSRELGASGQVRRAITAAARLTEGQDEALSHDKKRALI